MKTFCLGFAKKILDQIILKLEDQMDKYKSAL